MNSFVDAAGRASFDDEVAIAVLLAICLAWMHVVAPGRPG